MSDGVDLRSVGEALHRRLLDGDPIAPAEMAEVFLRPLAAVLRRRFPTLRDPQLVESAAEDSLMSYLENPSKFNPTRASLLGYLLMSARGDLLNLLAKERRRAEKVVELYPGAAEDTVEDLPEGGGPEEASLDGLDQTGEESPVIRRTLAKVTDPIDRELLSLMINGVRRTEEYAAILGITHLPPGEQRTVVKRHKDRIKLAVKRAIRPTGSH